LRRPEQSCTSGQRVDVAGVLVTPDIPPSIKILQPFPGFAESIDSEAGGIRVRPQRGGLESPVVMGMI
jgi:hypothetical protein